MRLHPRTQIVERAKVELALAVVDLAAKYDLTDAELVRILAQSLDERGRALVRDERHPDDPDKKGDEA